MRVSRWQRGSKGQEALTLQIHLVKGYMHTGVRRLIFVSSPSSCLQMMFMCRTSDRRRGWRRDRGKKEEGVHDAPDTRTTMMRGAEVSHMASLVSRTLDPHLMYHCPQPEIIIDRQEEKRQTEYSLSRS